MRTSGEQLIANLVFRLLKQRRKVLRQVNDDHRIRIRWMPSHRNHWRDSEPFARIHAAYMHEQVGAVGFKHLAHSAFVAKPKIVVK